jgi:hypothetical protein
VAAAHAATAGGQLTAGPDAVSMVTGTPVPGQAATGRPDAAAGYTPGDLQQAYGLTPLNQGARQTVAIVTPYNEKAAAADLTGYRSAYGIPPCTSTDGCFSQVDQGSSAPPSPPAGSAAPLATATAMDMVSATCPNCHIMLAQADGSSIGDLAATLDVAVHRGPGLRRALRPGQPRRRHVTDQRRWPARGGQDGKRLQHVRGRCRRLHQAGHQGPDLRL